MKNLIKALILFNIGGTAYYIIEVLYKQLMHGTGSHWTMYIVGGLAFLLIGSINEVMSWETPFSVQCLIGGTIVTLVELISGIIINVILKWNVWDYSGIPFNIMGQVCITFTVIWCLLSIVAIIVDDLIRWKLFGEEKPKYK